MTAFLLILSVFGALLSLPLIGKWWGTRKFKRMVAAVDSGKIPPYHVVEGAEDSYAVPQGHTVIEVPHEDGSMTPMTVRIGDKQS